VTNNNCGVLIYCKIDFPKYPLAKLTFNKNMNIKTYNIVTTLITTQVYVFVHSHLHDF